MRPVLDSYDVSNISSYEQQPFQEWQPTSGILFSLPSNIYRVIRKSLWNFRNRLRNNQDRQQKGAYQYVGNPSTSFLCTRRRGILASFTARGGSRGETWRGQGIRKRSVSCNLPKLPNLTSAASPRVDISSTCKIGQKLGVSVPLLTCSPSAWRSRSLYRRGRKSRRDLWITLW